MPFVRLQNFLHNSNWWPFFSGVGLNQIYATNNQDLNEYFTFSFHLQLAIPSLSSDESPPKQEQHNFYCRFPQKHFVESPEAYPVNNVLESIWTGLYSDILTTWLLSKSYHQIWAKIFSLRNVLFKCKYQRTGSTEFLIAVHPLFFTMGNCLCWVGNGRHRTIISTTKIL